MKKKVILLTLAIIAIAIFGGGATSALFTAQSAGTEGTFRAATVALSTTGSLDFDSQTLNLAPGESPNAHVDTVTVLPQSTIDTKLYVIFTIEDLQLGPYDPSDTLSPYSLAEGLVVDSVEYVDGSTVKPIASGITFDELVNNGMRTATCYLGEIPANDTTGKNLIFKWHFPDHGAADNRYQGASFRLDYYFYAEQAH